VTIYFAWVDSPGSSSGADFGPEHVVQDENVVSFRLDHNEGDFATLSVDVENPRVAPLAPGRPIWAWLSWRRSPADEVVPLFIGRLVGVPSNILGNIITYQFRARPSDYVEVKAALADTLRVLPFYDEVFVDPARRTDPDVVLEGYSKTWHIDRTSHAVSVSDFLVGEDGVEVFEGTGDVIDGSLAISLDGVPLTSITVNGEFPWSQAFSGTVSLPSKTWTSLAGFESWPKAGDTLAGGYYVISSSASQTNAEVEPYTINFNYTNREKTHDDGDVMSINESKTDIHGYAIRFRVSESSYSVNGDPATGTPASGGREEHGLAVSQGTFTGSMVLGINATGARKDALSVVVTSDLQPVLKDPDDTSDSEIIDLPTVGVGDECGSEAAPIGNIGRGEYVTTDRGLLSVQYMIARARARLVIGARVVSLSWECPFDRAVNLSCRKNAQIFHHSIPGGEAVGKVVSYSLRGDGRTGEFRGGVKISCAVGWGNAISTSAGTADYVDESYVDDYQTFTGQIVAMASGDIGFGPPTRTGGAAGIVSPTARDLVIRDEIVGSLEEQEDALISTSTVPLGLNYTLALLQAKMEENAKRMANQLANTQTWREIELIDLTNEGVESQWQIDTTPLVIPRQIDLTASATA
jgi:hypothetical protein